MTAENIFYWAIANGDKVLAWVLSAVGVAIAAFVLGKIGEGKAKEIVARALNELGAAVLEVKQTFVDSIKAASADGTLTPAEKAEAKARAIAIAKSNLGSKGLARLAKIIGVDVEGWLSNKLEAIVASAPSSVSPFLPKALTKKSI